MSTFAIGALCLVAALLFHWLRIFVKIRAILAFVGTCIVTGGLFGHALTWVVLHVQALTNSLTGKIFGAAIPGLVVIVLAIIFVHDLHPKGGGSSRRTMFVGAALAACLVAGVSSFSTLNNVPAAVRTGVSSSTNGG